MRETGDLGEDVKLTVQRGDRGERNERSFASGDRVMFLRNERSLAVKNGTLGTIVEVSQQSMVVRTDDGRSVSFDLKDYDRIDHGYAATVHKAQGMTVDRTHVLATPGLDSHGSYVALSRHRDGTALHYGRNDFATPDKLVNALSRDRSKDMATDYERSDAGAEDPARRYAERRGISFRDRVIEIVKQIVPERVRERIEGMLDGLRSPSAPREKETPGAGEVERPERERADAEVQRKPDAPERESTLAADVALDPDAIMRRRRTEALIRHASAADAILEVRREGLLPSAEQRGELGASRRAFEEVYPSGWRDAEAAYNKDNSLAHEAANGSVGRAVRAIQLEAEIRTGRDAGTGLSAASRADRFVDRWTELGETRQRQYVSGDMSGYKSTGKEMANMAKSLERDPQMESLLANRKKELGINGDMGGKSLGRALAFVHGIDLGLGRGIGL